MSPCVREAPPPQRQRLEADDQLAVTVDFIISTHRVWLGAARGRFER